MEVDSLDFLFPTHFMVAKYDDDFTSFKQLSSSMQFECECSLCPSHSCKKKSCPSFQYCNRQRQNEGLKGVDIIALDDKQKMLFLIEAKDYRKEHNPPVDHIVAEVVKKFRDTLFGIWCGSLCETEKDKNGFLRLTRTKPFSLSFVFHFESPLVPYRTGLHRKSLTGDSKVVSLTTLKQRLMQKLGPMKNYVTVCNMETTNNNCAWTVTERTQA